MATERNFSLPLSGEESQIADGKIPLDNSGKSRTRPRRLLVLSHNTGSLGRQPKPFQQTARLAKDQVGRLILTCFFCILVIVTLKSFQHDGNLRLRYKVLFNTIITALSLGLGLNFFDAFKDMARVLRWRLLSHRAFTPREADLILGGDSLLKLLVLAREAFGKPFIFFTCMFWLLLNIGAQIAVAIISLTYNMENGIDSNGTFTTQDLVSVPKLDCFYNPNTYECLDAPESNLTFANAYGRLIRGAERCMYLSNDRKLPADQLCDFYYREDWQEFTYRFREWNANDRTFAYPYLTDRTIQAYPGKCHEYKIREPIQPVNTPDGPETGWVYSFYNETYNSSLWIPRFDAAFDATTYIYNSLAYPQEVNEMTCGDRCLQMFAFRSKGVRSNRTNAMFSCPITISEVSNPTQPAHHVTADIAKIAAAAIALHGRYTTPDDKRPDEKDWHQFQLYPWGSDWEIHDITAQEVGSRMAEFAIGSIRGLAQNNPHHLIPGTLPTLGYHLDVYWAYAIALMACIALVHALLFVAMLWISQPVIVIDDSNLCVARLLQGLVQRIGGSGSLLDGKEIAKAIQEASKGDVAYGVKRFKGIGDPMTLVIDENVPTRRKMPGKEFPWTVYV